MTGDGGGRMQAGVEWGGGGGTPAADCLVDAPSVPSTGRILLLNSNRKANMGTPFV